jgi:DNA-binding transcriptional LysR family regulator
MRLRHIEVFHAIRQTGSISQAAKLLGVTQPAASKVLQHAERTLGFKLFERVKGRLHPTVEADILYVEVDRLHQGLDQLKALALNLRRYPEGRLHVGCLPSMGLSILPRVIRAFRGRYPSVTCEVETNHLDALVSGLRSRQLDLAVIYGEETFPDLRSQPLGECELVYLGPQAGGDLALESLEGEDLIGIVANDSIGRIIAGRFAQLGVKPKPQIEVQTYYVACAMAAEGCGATIVDEITARSMQREGLHIRRVRPALTTPLAVLTHERNVIRGFYDGFTALLQQVVQDIQRAAPPSRGEAHRPGGKHKGG